MVCDAVGRIDVWQTEGMRKLMTEETDTIDVVFAVLGICRLIVQLVVDAEPAYFFSVIGSQSSYGTRFRPEIIALITYDTFRIAGINHIYEVYISVAIAVVIGKVYLAVYLLAGFRNHLRIVGVTSVVTSVLAIIS